MRTFPHLHPQLEDVAAMDYKQRMDYLGTRRYANHPGSAEVLAELDLIYKAPRSHRMPWLMVAGDSGVGKSTAVRKFASAINSAEPHDDETQTFPVLMVEMPPDAVEKRLYVEIINELGVFPGHRTPVDQLQYTARTLIANCQVRMLVLDEAQHLLSGTPHRRIVSQNAIKNLCNKMQISLVCVGVMETFDAVNHDKQMVSRFRRIVLKRFDNDKQYGAFLQTLESLLPLRHPSNLALPHLTAMIHTRTEGVVSFTWDLLESAARAALVAGKEFVDEKTIKSMKWVRPSDRNKRDQY